MAETKPRKHQVVEEAEITLVLQCRDSHEFYERYRESFPKSKKGIDSISRIWKRRSEFAKRQQAATPDQAALVPAPAEAAPAKPFVPAPGLEDLLAIQAKNMEIISALMKEHIEVSKEILAILQKQNPAHIEKKQKPKDLQDHLVAEPVKHIPAKPAGPIVVGS
jgi:hypothetical protein